MNVYNEENLINSGFVPPILLYFSFLTVLLFLSLPIPHLLPALLLLKGIVSGDGYFL
jgi:hypothetical protein